MSRKDAYIQNRNGSNSNATGKIYNESVLTHTDRFLVEIIMPSIGAYL